MKHSGFCFRSVHNGAIAILIFSLAVPFAAGQDSPSEPELQSLRKKIANGDSLVLTLEDGMKLEATLLELTLPAFLKIRAGGSERVVSLSQITRIQRKKNGVLLGALIGLGAGVALSTQVGCDAGVECDINPAAIRLALVGMGVGAGIAIDAFIVKPRTVYEGRPQPRVTFGPLLDGKRVGAIVRIN